MDVLQQNSNKFLQQLLAAAAGANPLDFQRAGTLPALRPQMHLMLADPLLQLHVYWKSKVIEAHCHWKKVTGSVDVSKLDREILSADNEFANCKMETFKLGDRVKIVAKNKRMFKILHKKVGIWTEGLAEVMGKEAIVMNLSSRFAIVVALVDSGDVRHIHGFALKTVNKHVDEGIWRNTTSFKPDDEVVIGVDDGVLAHMQISVRKTPYVVAAQLQGFIARVMCVFRGEVVVTFDEINHEMFNPAVLTQHSNQTNGDKRKLTKQPGEKGFGIGAKVTVKRNLLDVMRNQLLRGAWNYKLTKFVGKEGEVIDTAPVGDVVVKFSPFESYLMNRNAVTSKDRKKGRNRRKSGTELGSLPFAVGDIVRFNTDKDDLMSILQLYRIPNAFSAIASDCMSFVGYVDQTRGVVDVGGGIEFILELKILTKVDDLMSNAYKQLRQSDNEIGVGKKVSLLIGPNVFVKACLQDLKDGFEKATNETAVMEGYDDDGNAVIRYGDGEGNGRTWYSMPDEYLCSPRPLWRSCDNDRVPLIDWSRVPHEVPLPRSQCAVEAKILHSVTEVLKANKENDILNWKSVIIPIKGMPNTSQINVTFPGQIGDYERFKQTLKSKLGTEQLQAVIHDDDKFSVQTDGWIYIMVFIFGAEESTSTEDEIAVQAPTGGQMAHVSSQGGAPVTSPDFTRSQSVNEAFGEPGVPGNLATPMAPETGAYNISIPTGVRQVVLHIGGAPRGIGAQQEPPPPLPLGASRGSNIVVNPATMNATFNMYGDGKNQVEINRSYVRSVNQQ